MAWMHTTPMTLPNIPCNCGLKGDIHGYIGLRLIGAQAKEPGGYIQDQTTDIDHVVFNYKDRWIMAKSDTIKFGVAVSGAFLALQATEIDGWGWFKSENKVLYHVDLYGWVYTESLPAGTEPREWYDEELEAWKGDVFWASPSLLGELLPRGPAYDEESTVGVTCTDYEPDYKRWELLDSGANYLGVYLPVDGASGNRYVGNGKWRGEYRTWVQESFHKNTYKVPDLVSLAVPFRDLPAARMSWDVARNKMIIGTYNSITGWWETAGKPIPGVDYTLNFTLPVGVEAEAEDNITLTWYGFDEGDLARTQAAGYVLELGVLV